MRMRSVRKIKIPSEKSMINIFQKFFLPESQPDLKLATSPLEFFSIEAMSAPFPMIQRMEK